MYTGMQNWKIRSATVMFLSLHCSNIGIWLQDCIFAHLFPDLQRRVEKFRSAVTPAAQVLLRKGRRCAAQMCTGHCKAVCSFGHQPDVGTSVGVDAHVMYIAVNRVSCVTAQLWLVSVLCAAALLNQADRASA
jgi:hypothetical protein